MTIHSAKGLEFPTVFVVGLEENLFPNQMTVGNPREIEEERRLFYVAITRAQFHCFITYARNRFHFGKMEFANPSRFLHDIDAEFVHFIGGSSTRRSNEVELPWMKKCSFVDTWRKPDEQPSRSNYQPNPVVQQAPSGFTRVSTSTPATSLRNHSLKPGQHIQHERFGEGEVLKVEGQGDNMKATVRFINAGTKQLLLKFARFTVIL